MGGGGSKQTIRQKLLTDISTSISTSVRNSCSSAIRGEQIVRVVGNNNVVTNIQQEAYYSVSADCRADSSMVNEIIMDITNKFSAEMKKNADALSESFKALLDAGDDQKMNNEIETVLRNNISAEVVNECLATIERSQKQVVLGNNNIVSGNSQKDMVRAAINCVASSKQVNNVLTEIFNESKFDQEYEVKGPLSWVGDLMSNVVYIVIMLVILVILAVGAYLIYRARSGSDGADAKTGGASGIISF